MKSIRISPRRTFAALLLIALSYALGGHANVRGEVRMEYLENRLAVIHKKTTATNILGVVCIIRAGSAYEGSKENGITSLVQALLMKGTEHYTAAQLALAIEREGIIMETDASEDYATLSVEATVDQLDRVLELMAEILFNPTFPENEVAKERRNAIANIHLQEDDKFYLTMRRLRELLYEGDPYSRPPEGSPETLAALKRRHIIDFHSRYFQPENMIVSIVGNVEYGEVKKCLMRHFGSRPSRSVNLFTTTKVIKPTLRKADVKKPLEQGFIIIGYNGVPMSDKDYPALRVACALLGEGMASRLFVQLRDQRGLAYAVGSFYHNLRLHGSVMGYIGTRPETLMSAEKAMRGIFEELAEKKIPEDEIARARNFIVGKYLIAHQTNLRQAFYLAWFHVYGMGLDYDEKYPALITAVTGRDVRRVARKYLSAPAIVILSPSASSGQPSHPKRSE